MATWGVAGLVFGAWVAVSAGLRGGPVHTRVATMAAAVAYATVCAWTATLAPLWVHLVVPGAALLCGYWLPAPLFDAPQPSLERLLLDQDRRLFEAFNLDRRLACAPHWVIELLEVSYASVYPTVAAGAVISALAGRDAVATYWALVLGAGLTCYAALPWLRSRPPRTLEAPGTVARRRPAVRRLNGAVLDAASVQVNTLPSGHVAAALAAALGLVAVSGVASTLAFVASAMIAAAAVTGRYHYAIDCVTGALVAMLAWYALV